jgi:hypothetical protein
MTAQPKALNCFRPLEYRDRGFESHSKNGYMSVLVFLCVGRGLETDISPVQEDLPTCKIHSFQTNSEAGTGQIA